MRDNKWIKGAILLGISFFIAILLVKPVGVSTQFSVLSGRSYYMINPNIISSDDAVEGGYTSTNAYYNRSNGKIAGQIMNPFNYSMVFVFAIPLGAYIGYKLSKKSKKMQSGVLDETDASPMDDAASENKQVEAMKRCEIRHAGFLNKYLPMFIGGFLLLFGARFAGGCTSGHMMSGMMQSSVSGYVFAGVVFAIAIPTAIISEKVRGHMK